MAGVDRITQYGDDAGHRGDLSSPAGLDSCGTLGPRVLSVSCWRAHSHHESVPGPRGAARGKSRWKSDVRPSASLCGLKANPPTLPSSPFSYQGSAVLLYGTQQTFQVKQLNSARWFPFLFSSLDGVARGDGKDN